MSVTPRELVLSAAMQLFSDRDFAGTTITQIERAAGLSPGSGGLYRHFPSKRAILAAGVASSFASNAGLVSLINDPDRLASLPLRDRLLTLSRAGLRRLEEGGDLDRLVMRDLSLFPDLLAQVGQDDIGRIFRAFAGWLQAQPDVAADRDWEAIAMVLMGAVTHLWIMCEIVGEHPAGIDEDRYLTAAADLAAALLSNQGDEQ